MCGIAGVTQNNLRVAEEMATQIKHRGPDAEGFFNEEGIALAHTRLSIIDVSARSNQPMRSADNRFVLVFNGEIYNYAELKKELPEYSFVSTGDTEVLLAGYMRWGETFFNKVRGIFACAIWDREKKELVLVRDQMGVKPLYYALKNDVLYFCSELSGVIKGAGLQNLSLPSLTLYLGIQYVPAPNTLVEGIQSLSPAHVLRYRQGDLIIRRYWEPETPRKGTQQSSAAYDVINAAVERQMIAERPVGLLLSGGLDSSILLHHASRHNPSIETFSTAFESVEESQKYNMDAHIAQRTARHYGVRHTTFSIHRNFVATHLPQILEKLDQPIANPTNVTRYIMSGLMRDAGIVVGLGGDGSDELFGGYERHQIILASEYFKKLPPWTKSGLASMMPRLHKLNLPFGPEMHSRFMSLSQDKILPILKQRVNVEDAIKNIFQAFYDSLTPMQLSPVDQFMRVDRETWLMNESLLQTDITSMAHGLEMRVPFLDLDVVNFADSISGKNKFSVLQNKKILREAYRDVLPAYLFKGKKRGWLSPGAKWLRDPSIHSYAKEVFSDEYYSGLSSSIDWHSVQQLLEAHVTGGAYHLYPLWNLLQLQVWAKKNNIVSN